MKLHLLLASLLLSALPVLGQAHPTSTSEWQRQQIQQREMDRQRQQLDQQRQALQRLQDEQRRATRAAERDAAYCEPVVIVPVIPRRVVVTPQNRTAVNNYIARVMADKTLTLDQKLRLIDGVTGAPRP